jgi:outer membrane scaffolding protein for murein synthesis (MipA/OmpV family)
VLTLLAISTMPLLVAAADSGAAGAQSEEATAGTGQTAPTATPPGESSTSSLKPLWEFGLGPAALILRDYRGADTTHAYPLPAPYIVYRGKFLQADRDGLKEKIFDQRLVELHISASATPPVRQNAARSGMPDLKPTVEIGPAFDTKLWRSNEDRVKFDFLVSARAAFSLEASPRMVGWLFDPHLNLDIGDPFGQTGWKLGFLAGPLFADRRYHEYFYAVAPQFATAERPAYEPKGGYAGTQFLTSLTKRFPGYWVGSYVRYDTLSGAAFAGSPLVKEKSYWSAGVAVAWMIKQSTHLVEANE